VIKEVEKLKIQDSSLDIEKTNINILITKQCPLHISCMRHLLRKSLNVHNILSTRFGRIFFSFN